MFLLGASLLLATRCMADTPVDFKSFQCTSVANSPSGDTTVTFNGRNPLNGRDTFTLRNDPMVGIPYSQILILAGTDHEGPTLVFKFRAASTKAEFELKFDPTSESAILNANGFSKVEMNCKADLSLRR